MTSLVRPVLCMLLALLPAAAQSLGSAGTINGSVTDPSGAAIAGATVMLKNALTGFKRSTTSGPDGNFRIPSIPPNTYHLDVTSAGFADFGTDVQVRTNIPISVKATLKLAESTTSVTVEAAGSDILENVPYAHHDVDQSQLSKLPATSPGSGLSDAITMSAPGVVADSNGFFHPLGDHAQVTFRIDGQPISDQQSKQFSTQIPVNAIQSMELITGSPNAEFGDKTSLVVDAVTKSGIGQKPFGSFSTQYGSFGTIAEESTFGMGNAKVGNFVALNALRSGRFLDTPEFHPMHAVGNNYTMFDHLDYRPNSADNYHIDLFHARNWFQVPNTYDQPNQDQRQKTLTFNIAPGYQRTLSANTLLTINTFLRQDQVNFYRSRDVFADSPATPQSTRRLTNWGVRSDISHIWKEHNVKVGLQIMQTRLSEQFSLGITDPDYNPVCLDQQGNAVDSPSVTNPARCGALGYTANPELLPGLVPLDLTRGGSLLSFTGRKNINQYAFFAQDTITLGHLTLTPGLRVERYNGLVAENGVQPRIGASYRIRDWGTVLRASYARTFETPYNENLVLSSSTGSGGLAQNTFGGFGAAPIRPGRRNQYNAGLQQAIHNLLLVDADYFWKFTDNAFDFGTLLNTPITFPISWRKSNIDGFSLRVSTVNLHGFQANVTMGHTRARYFGPSVGGLIFNSPLQTEAFRIDHDQAFESTANLRYQLPKNGAWFMFTWRYDSGLVAGAVPDLETALGLSAAQQSAIGFYCGAQQATLVTPITACTSQNYGATRLRIPAPGTADPDRNPARIAPRHIFSLGLGDDNVLHGDKVKVFARLHVDNLTNEAALYNFLSTFSGTHFVTPRAIRAEVGFSF